jgi:arsenite oxidase small subunit
MVANSACAGCEQQRRQLMLGLLSLPLLAVSSARVLAAADEPVARVADLSEPWSAVTFNLRDQDGDPLPCIIVRLPAGGWYASSLICPHNKCDIQYMRDPASVRSAFDVDVSTPVLGCPCHFSVFELARQGQVVAGPAPSPPQQLKLEIRDGNVFARW